MIFATFALPSSFILRNKAVRFLPRSSTTSTSRLDTHSYEACLRAIHAADYFVLLIGNRVGGWYDEPNRISITLREYREAYQLQVSGKLRLLNFVRSEIWQVKETRHEFIKFLESTHVDEGTRKAISNHPSKFASDAEFLSNFINEVARNQETKLAVQGKGVAPSGNWIHIFDTFRDVIQSKHVDIVACDLATLGIRFVLELDDSTHSQPRRQSRDQFVDKALQAAGIPVIHVSAKKGYSVQDIQSILSHAGVLTKT